jgi:ubiquinone/menaquinone biosynthesis C-methylase UbiE/uncharacterized protein YbaR (Trm112 family)
VTTALLEILCDPGSNEPLSRDGDWLVGPGDRRWPVVEGIPLLLPEGVGALPGREAIVEASRARSASYYRDNYGVCGNPERQARMRAVAALLGRLVRPGATILDAGAGPATLADEIRSRAARYVALDLSLENLRAGGERVGELDAVVGDVTALPVRAAAVDGVVAAGCLEYVPELPRAIGELCRVVRPGGFVLASFANRRSPRRIWDERVVLKAARLRGGAIYRRYLHGADEVTELFRRSGADVSEIRYLNPGLIGFPLSELRVLRSAQAGVARRMAAARRLASEFLLVALRQ